MNKRTTIIFQRHEIEKMLLNQGIKMPEAWDMETSEMGSLSVWWEEDYLPNTFSLQYVFAPEKMASLQKLTNGGEWISAIKEVRTLTGWGLKESKDYIEYNFKNGRNW